MSEGWTLAPDVRFRVVADEAVIVRQQVAEVLVVNAVGARILELLRDGAPLDELAATVADEFDVAADRAAGDVEAFLASLRESGVLVQGGSP